MAVKQEPKDQAKLKLSGTALADILKRKRVEQPDADTLYTELINFLDWCDANGDYPTKALWQLWLGITSTTWYNWQDDRKGKKKEDAEFNARLEVLKKIEMILEDKAAQEMLKSDKPAGKIFYLKNIYKWQDKQDAPEIKVAITGYAVPTLKDVTTEKSDKKSDKITDDNL